MMIILISRLRQAFGSSSTLLLMMSHIITGDALPGSLDVHHCRSKYRFDLKYATWLRALARSWSVDDRASVSLPRKRRTHLGETPFIHKFATQ